MKDDRPRQKWNWQEHYSSRRPFELESFPMIADRELAKQLDSVLRGVMLALDQSAALVREQSEPEAARYAAGVGAVFMCIYSHILDPIYVDHPDIAPPSWTLEPELDGK